MSHSPDAEDFIVAQWEAALNDARVSPADYHLITCPGAPVPDHAPAVSFRRGHVVDGSEGGIVVTADKLLEAEQYAQLNRVATFEDWDEDDPVAMAFLAGLLRHEIEHGIQRDKCPNSFELYDLTEAVIRHAVQDTHNWRELINTQPIEWDANAAASMYLRHHTVHQAAVPDLLAGPHTFLVRSELGPGDPQKLVARTVGYLYSLRDACLKQEARQSVTFDVLIEGMVPGAGALWRELDAARLC